MSNVRGTYRLVANFLNGTRLEGDWFTVETYAECTRLRVIAREVQDIAEMEQFSMMVDGNQVGLQLSNITYIMLEKQ
jgi:hypothetical protein